MLADNRFICLLAIRVSSSGKYLSKSLPIFQWVVCLFVVEMSDSVTLKKPSQGGQCLFCPLILHASCPSKQGQLGIYSLCRGQLDWALPTPLVPWTLCESTPNPERKKFRYDKGCIRGLSGNIEMEEKQRLSPWLRSKWSRQREVTSSRTFYHHRSQNHPAGGSSHSQISHTRISGRMLGPEWEPLTLPLPARSLCLAGLLPSQGHSFPC